MSGEDQLALGAVVLLSALLLGGVLWAKRGRSPEEMRALSLRISANRYPYALLGTGAIGALVGVGMFVHANTIDVYPLDLAALEEGAELDATFVEFRGVALPERRFCRRTRRIEQCYTPILAAPDSVHMAAVLAGDAPPGPGQWSGFISRSDQLSFRRQLEAQGMQTAPDLVRVLPESRTERANAGVWVAVGGVSLLSFGLAWWVRLRPRTQS